MKKPLLVSIIVVIIVVITVIIILCNKSTSDVIEINDLVDLSSIDSIVLVNGRNGDITELFDEEEMKGILNSLHNLKLTKTNSEDNTGWIFALLLTSGNSETKITFIDKDKCKIDGNEYTIQNCDSKLMELFD